jgi:hypothetical protein
MYALVLIGLLAIQDPDVDALLKQLEDDSIETREKAASALIELGDKSEERVRTRMAGADGELKLLCKRILEQIAVPKKLRGLLPPIRKVTIDARDRSLKEVLDDLQAQSGLPMELGAVGEGTVTVSIKEATPLEALDAVCKAAGFGYSLDNNYRNFAGKGRVMAAGGPGFGGDMAEPKVRLQPGSYLNAPRLFIRHYLIEPTQINLSKSDNFRQTTTSANLSLRVAWPPNVTPQTGEISVTSVTDDKGRTMYEAPKAARKFSSVQQGYMGGGLNSYIQLAYPEADARKIASVKGKAVVKFLLEEKLLAFDPVEGGETQKKDYDGMTVELTSYKADAGNITVSLTFTGRPRGTEGNLMMGAMHNFPIRLRTEDGNSGHGYNRMSRSGGNESSTLELTFSGVSGKVKVVEVVADTLYHSDSFDFELKDIPLPK